ncbi:MAG: FAD-binding oxidoreductase [Woeseiaceae bacterium]|nr:FAD-binding oxidoreductase [Woeseiaceae bacterium]
MYADPLTRTGQYRVKRIIDTPRTGPVTETPTDLNQLRRLLDPASRTPLPIRVQGAGSACNDCNTTESGTTICMTGLDRIIHVDSYNHTVTTQAGVLVGDLVRELAEHGLELPGSYDLAGRTVGGAIAAPCFGPAIGGGGSYFASNVITMKLLRPDGQVFSVEAGQNNLLGAFRMSFGTLGIIYEVKLSVRPIRTFTASHRRVSIDKFATIVDALASADVGIKFYLMPYRDRVYLDVRRYDTDPGSTYTTPWKLKDWGESTVLPHIFKSLNRVVPMQSVRYRLIDTISETTQNLVNSRYVKSGSNATSQSDRARGKSGRRCFYSTWCFPAADFSMVVRAYRDFCARAYEESQYRCDMPAVGYRLGRDPGSLLSPSFEEPMFALTSASTQERGWDDFVIDLAEFAEKYGGIPLISQSRALRAEHVIQSYNRRLDFFRRMRRKLDPDKRFLNPFLAQFMQ